MRRLLHIFSVALITAGIVILTDAGLTLAWKEPLSAIYGHFQQSAAQDQLDTQAQTFLDNPKVKTLGPTKDEVRRADELAAIYAKQISDGQGIGKIKVPSVDIDFVVIQGTDDRRSPEGAGPLPHVGATGTGQDRRDRRPSDHLPGAVQGHRRHRDG